MTLRGTAFLLAGLAASLGAGWLVFPRVLYRAEPQPLAFSHVAHAASGMACEDCHAFRDDGRFSGIPAVAKCAECHTAPMGATAEEKRLVDEFVTPAREIPWKVYSRQPDHVFFSHATHVKAARLACEDCHGPHGRGESLPAWEVNRLSGYSRSIWGHSLARFARESWEGKKMTDCSDCHRRRGVEESCLDCHK